MESHCLAVSAGLLAAFIATGSPTYAQCGPACRDPLTICAIPTLRVHVDFPVNYRAWHNWIGCSVGYTWDKLSGPPEFDLDGAGGLFYWTPATAGQEIITIEVETLTGRPAVDTETFIAIVDDNTMTYPLWRDYLDQQSTVTVEGRAHDTPDASFVSYTLDFAETTMPDGPPGTWMPIAGPIFTPVPTTGPLAEWNISALPDGGRYYLRLTVDLNDGTQSVVENQVIVDRSAQPGWPKRVGPITHSPVLADITDNGRDEVLVVTHFGDLFAWDIDGTELWVADMGGSTYSAPSVGDIDGDGRPEIVWTIGLSYGVSRLVAHNDDGTLVAGFPLIGPPDRLLRVTPTLVDLDGDDVLDIVVGARANPNCNCGAQFLAYRYDTASETLQPLAGWPVTVEPEYWSVYASVSHADLDGDGNHEVVAEASTGGLFSQTTKAYAWHADGTPLAGWENGVLMAVHITGANTNGAGSFDASAQPAIADLDGDGVAEIIIGPNVLAPDGTQLHVLAGATPSLSAAVGEVDGNTANGLEIVLGDHVYHADGTPVTGFPLSTSLASAVIGQMDHGGVAITASPRSLSAPPGVFAHDELAEPVEGYPKSLYGNTGDAGAPVIGDFDRDGLTDVAAAITDASYGGIVAVWQCPDSPNEDEQHDWPMMGHDVLHSGAYAPPRPNRPGYATRTVAPGGVQLAWDDRSDVEDEYVVERSETGEAWSFAHLATLGANSTSYLDMSAGAEAASYRIRAVRIDPGSGDRTHSAFAPAECGGDLDGDGSVATADLLALLGAWGPNPGHPADLDGDGTVATSDLLILLGSWGPCP